MTVDVLALASAEAAITREHQLREKVVNEEFKIWKKTVPLLYDTIYTHALDFPSLSVKFLPDYVQTDDAVTVKFLYGTNSAQQAQDYLKLGSVQLPPTLAPEFSGPTPVPHKPSSFQVLQTWKHNGEINKLEIAPSGASALTFDSEGTVHLYSLSDASAPVDFKYHKLEGYALQWLNDNEFLSGSSDSQIALWDVSKPATPIQCYKSHNAVVNDLSLNPRAPFLFGSVSDDYTTQVHDLRAPASESVAIKILNKHIQNAIGFHHEIDSLVAVGGRDNVVSLYDLRNPRKPFRRLFGHNDSVTGLKWDVHHNPNKLVSWSLDKRVMVWELDHLDEEFSYPDVSEGSRRRNNNRSIDPCLRFISGGHTNKINDVDLHPKISGLTITTGDDNLLEVWRAKTIPEEEEEEEEEEPEEQKEDVEMEDAEKQEKPQEPESRPEVPNKNEEEPKAENEQEPNNV